MYMYIYVKPVILQLLLEALEKKIFFIWLTGNFCQRIARGRKIASKK